LWSTAHSLQRLDNEHLISVVMLVNWSLA